MNITFFMIQQLVQPAFFSGVQKSGSLENGILRIVLPKEQKKVENSNRIEIK